MAAPAAWPTVPPLRIQPPPLQLPLLEDVAPAAAWERRYISSVGGPVVVVRIARLPAGAGWRVSFGLAHADADGNPEQPIGAALDVDTYGAARAAADFGWLFVDGAARALVQHIAGAVVAAGAVEPVGPRPVRTRRRVLSFTRRDALAPTG